MYTCMCWAMQGRKQKKRGRTCDCAGRTRKSACPSPSCQNTRQNHSKKQRKRKLIIQKQPCPTKRMLHYVGGVSKHSNSKTKWQMHTMLMIRVGGMPPTRPPPRRPQPMPLVSSVVGDFFDTCMRPDRNYVVS